MMTRFPSGVWAIVLIASVLVNGLILGLVVAGAMMNVEVGRGRSQIGSGPSFPAFQDRIPEEARQEMMDGLRARALEARPLVEEMREASEAAMAALSADPFDEEAARAAFERTRAARAALEAQAHDITISLFANLPPETRESLAARAGPRVIMRGFDGDDRGPGRREQDWRLERRPGD